jgi:histidinol phosphatase-like PHP family hydrolase
MLSSTIAAYYTQVAESPEFRERLAQLQSPMEFFAIVQQQGLELTGAEFQQIVQNAYSEWLAQLAEPLHSFFAQAQSSLEINQVLKTLQEPQQVIQLAKDHGFELSIADLQQAAQIAATIPGFSFEKLWFRNLGL